MTALSFSLNQLSLKEQVSESYPQAWYLHLVGYSAPDRSLLVSWCSQDPDETVLAAFCLDSQNLEVIVSFPGVFSVVQASVPPSDLSRAALVARLEEEDEENKTRELYQVFAVEVQDSDPECWPLTDPLDSLLHVHFLDRSGRLLILCHGMGAEVVELGDGQRRQVCGEFLWATWDSRNSTLFHLQPDGQLLGTAFLVNGSSLDMFKCCLPESSVWLRSDERVAEYLDSVEKLARSDVNLEVILGDDGLVYVCYQHYGSEGGASRREEVPTRAPGAPPCAADPPPIKKTDVRNIWRLNRACSYRNNTAALQILESTPPRPAPTSPPPPVDPLEPPGEGLYSVVVLFLHQGCRVVASTSQRVLETHPNPLQFFKIDDYVIAWQPGHWIHLLDMGSLHSPGHHIVCSDRQSLINEESFCQPITVYSKTSFGGQRAWISPGLGEWCSAALDRECLATLLGQPVLPFGAKLAVVHLVGAHSPASYRASLAILNILRKNPYGLEAVYIIKEFILGTVMRRVVQEFGHHPCLLYLPLSINKDPTASTKVTFQKLAVKAERSSKLSLSDDHHDTFWSGRQLLSLTSGQQKAVYSWMTALDKPHCPRFDFFDIKLKWPFYVSKKKELVAHLKEALQKNPIIATLMALCEADKRGSSANQRDQLQVLAVFKEMKLYLHQCCPHEDDDTLQKVVFSYLKTLIREAHQFYYNLCVFFSLPAAFQWQHIEKRHSLRDLYSLMEAYMLAMESCLCPLPTGFRTSLFLLAFKCLDYVTFVNRIHQGILQVSQEAFEQIKDVGTSQKYKRKKLGMLSLLDKDQVKTLFRSKSISQDTSARPLSVWTAPVTDDEDDAVVESTLEAARRYSFHVTAGEPSYPLD